MSWDERDWREDEDFLRAASVVAANAPPGSPRPHRPRATMGRTMLVVAGLALAVALLPGPRGWFAAQVPWGPGLGWARGPEQFVDPASGLTVTVPAPPPDASGAPLGAPPTPPAGRGGYAFVQTNVDGSPVAFDPCRPIHVVINDELAPLGGRAELRRALSTMSAATGLRFVIDGSTTEPVATPRPVIQPDRYGDGWAPVLVAWTTPSEVPELAGDVLGVGGGQAFEGARDEFARYVTGVIMLDAAQVNDLPPHRRDGVVAQLLLHEIGHVLGLDHVSDPTQLMHDGLVDGQMGLGSGDRRGLALLGRGVCATQTG